MSNESHLFSDEIHIEQLEVFSHIGVPEDERANPQRLTVTISFWPSQPKTFPIQKVTIEIRKFVLEDAKYVSVTVTRSAALINSERADQTLESKL